MVRRRISRHACSLSFCGNASCVPGSQCRKRRQPASCTFLRKSSARQACCAPHETPHWRGESTAVPAQHKQCGILLIHLALWSVGAGLPRLPS
ncbi:hypothetical protein L511_2321 [Bordetella bronchiseptica MBORD595]|nr:hypothetical protein L511_2321 [Bordetella bronchiseptica MBORD595]